LLAYGIIVLLHMSWITSAWVMTQFWFMASQPSRPWYESTWSRRPQTICVNSIC